MSIQTIEVAPTKAVTAYMMRGVITNALLVSGALNTAGKKKHFIDFMVNITASAYLSGMVSASPCELSIDNILEIAHKRHAPFTDDELRTAFDVIVDNSTHGLGGNTDK